jgi:ADP-heptose:LPS heptosyltransferase
LYLQTHAVEALLEKERAHSNTLLVGLFFGAGHAVRRWPLERYAELADFLIRNDKVRIIVFAGPRNASLSPRQGGRSLRRQYFLTG